MFAVCKVLNMSASSAMDEDKIDMEMSDIELNEYPDNSDPLFQKQFCNGNTNKKDYDQDTIYSIPVVQGKLIQYMLMRF